MPFKKKREKAYFAKLSEERSFVVSCITSASFSKVLPQKSSDVISTFLLDCRKRTRSRSVQCFNCVDLDDKMSKQYVRSIINEKKQTCHTFY